jgi:hypothetical protein
MQCPQCGAAIPEGEWNCVTCRINVYWATQHFNGLARIRQQQGLAVAAPTPSFLLVAHADAMNERAKPGEQVDNKVRRIARVVMRQT